MKKLLMLIWWKTFFVWCTRHNDIIEYKKNLRETIFSAIELCKLPFIDIMTMPVKMLYDLLKWKVDIEEEKARLIKEKQGKTSTGPTRRK